MRRDAASPPSDVSCRSRRDLREDPRGLGSAARLREPSRLARIRVTRSLTFLTRAGFDAGVPAGDDREPPGRRAARRRRRYRCGRRRGAAGPSPRRRGSQMTSPEYNKPTARACVLRTWCGLPTLAASGTAPSAEDRTSTMGATDKPRDDSGRQPPAGRPVHPPRVRGTARRRATSAPSGGRPRTGARANSAVSSRPRGYRRGLVVGDEAALGVYALVRVFSQVWQVVCPIADCHRDGVNADAADPRSADAADPRSAGAPATAVGGPREARGILQSRSSETTTRPSAAPIRVLVGRSGAWPAGTIAPCRPDQTRAPCQPSPSDERRTS
jgi:hypothetical protein